MTKAEADLSLIATRRCVPEAVFVVGRLLWFVGELMELQLMNNFSFVPKHVSLVVGNSAINTDLSIVSIRRLGPVANPSGSVHTLFGDYLRVNSFLHLPH